MRYVIAAVAALVTAWSWLGATAQAQDVSVFPLRVVLEDRARGAEVVLLNSGDTAGSYRISLSDRHMGEDGRIVDFDDAHPKPANWPSAIDWVRFSPRQITLGPGQSQSIRLAVRRPADAMTGEYRAHLSIVALPPPETGESIEQALGRDPGAITITITPLYGVSIPVIVRIGQVAAAAQLTNPEIVRGQAGQQAMRAVLGRTGTGSVYGDLEVLSRNGSQERRIGLLRGVAVYPEVSSRPIQIPLDADAVARGHGGTTIIRYVSDVQARVVSVLAEVEGPPL